MFRIQNIDVLTTSELADPRSISRLITQALANHDDRVAIAIAYRSLKFSATMGEGLSAAARILSRLRGHKAVYDFLRTAAKKKIVDPSDEQFAVMMAESAILFSESQFSKGELDLDDAERSYLLCKELLVRSLKEKNDLDTRELVLRRPGRLFEDLDWLRQGAPTNIQKRIMFFLRGLILFSKTATAEDFFRIVNDNSLDEWYDGEKGILPFSILKEHLSNTQTLFAFHNYEIVALFHCLGILAEMEIDREELVDFLDHLLSDLNDNLREPNSEKVIALVASILQLRQTLGLKVDEDLLLASVHSYILSQDLEGGYEIKPEAILHEGSQSFFRLYNQALNVVRANDELAAAKIFIRLARRSGVGGSRAHLLCLALEVLCRAISKSRFLNISPEALVEDLERVLKMLSADTQSHFVDKKRVMGELELAELSPASIKGRLARKAERELDNFEIDTEVAVLICRSKRIQKKSPEDFLETLSKFSEMKPICDSLGALLHDTLSQSLSDQQTNIVEELDVLVEFAKICRANGNFKAAYKTLDLILQNSNVNDIHTIMLRKMKADVIFEEGDLQTAKIEYASLREYSESIFENKLKNERPFFLRTLIEDLTFKVSKCDRLQKDKNNDF